MRPDKMTVYQLFERQQRYVVPLFQRPYVWTRDDQWLPLWEDIQSKAVELLDGNNRDASSHFLGAAVIRKIDTYGRQVPTYEIIDGQQRLTTLQVLLAAFRSYLSSIGFNDLDRDLERLTINTGTRLEDVEQFKVWPTTADRTTFEAVFAAQDPLDLKRRQADRRAGSPLLADAYIFFFNVIKEFVIFGETDDEIDSQAYDEHSEMARSRIDALMDALRRHLEIVVIELERGDDPQIIFETLNARGVPLLPSDLIRNFAFLEASRDGEDIDRLYTQYWLMFDDYDRGQAQFWKADERQGRLSRPRIDLFMFHYLTSKVVQEVKITHLFQEFQRWWNQSRDKGAVSVETILKDIQRAATIYRDMMTASSTSRLSVFMQRLKIMDVSTLYPTVLYLLTERSDLPTSELDGMWTDLESYLVRRLVCGLTSKAYNRSFLTVLRDLRRATTVERAVLREILAGFDGDTGRWPSDAEFSDQWIGSPIYRKLSRSRIQLILEAIDLNLETSKQERLHIDDQLTVEHIYPQHPEAGIWEPLDNPDLIHSLGNLTLLTGALNSSISNGPFVAKRAEIAKQSKLRLNSAFQDLVGQETWSLDDIQSRANRLFETAVTIWPSPPATSSARLNSGLRRAVDSLSSEAEEQGIGEAFRTLAETGISLGLYPRVEASSILFAAQNDKRFCLYTIWVKPVRGMLRVYVQSTKFIEVLQLDPNVVENALGPDGYRELTHLAAQGFAAALYSLIGPAT